MEFAVLMNNYQDRQRLSKIHAAQKVKRCRPRPVQSAEVTRWTLRTLLSDLATLEITCGLLKLVSSCVSDGTWLTGDLSGTVPTTAELATGHDHCDEGVVGRDSILG